MPELTADQRHGARFLANHRVAYLADVPGLGKTAQYIRALDLSGYDTATVICPPILHKTVAREVRQWSLRGYNVTAIGSSRDAMPHDGIVTISYALATKPEVIARLKCRKTGILIPDEAHRLKSVDAQCSLGILGRAGLAREWSAALWWTSGTPAPNHAGELFTFAKLAGLWPGSYDDWVTEFCITRYGKYRTKIVGSKNIPELRALIAPRFLRRTEVTGRPPLAVDVAEVEGSDAFSQLAPRERAAIEAAVEAEDYEDLGGDITATARRLVGVAKIPGTIELAKEALTSGHPKVLIFGVHTDTLRAICAGLQDYGARLLIGETSARECGEIEDEFQKPDSPCRVIVANDVKAGEGLTLTAASRVLIHEPAWNPKGISQTVARAWRKGQTRPVHASLVALANGLDVRVLRLLRRKATELGELFD